MTCRRALGMAMILASIVVTATGCGSRPVTIKGQVTLDGQPVGPGSISFLPLAGTNSRKASAAIEDGNYEIPADLSPSPGTFRVEITWSKKTGRQISSADPGMMTHEIREAIPAKFNQQSQLTVEITPGDNVKDFILHSR